MDGAAAARLTRLPGPPVSEPAEPGRRTTRDWLVDSGACLLAAGWAAGLTALAATGQLPLPPWLLAADVVAGWLAVPALLLRRRWPVGLAVALMPTGLFSMTTGMAALIALFTVASRRRLPIALALGGWYAATAVPFFLYHHNPLQPGSPYWWDILWAVLVTAVAVGWGTFARARRQLLASLRDRAERAEAEQQLRAEQARHLERERIAREMHDVLAHRISLLSMHAGGLEYRPDADRAEIAHAAGVIRRCAHQALQDLREVLGVLRAGAGDDVRPQPTLADLAGLLAEARAGGARIRCDDQLPAEPAVPPGVGRTAYRVIQEGLTNARKHAPGTTVEITLAGAPGAGLTVTLRNGQPVGGPPAEPIPGAGTGLVGLAERVALAGGRLAHGPEPAGEFRLQAWLPWST